MLRLFHCLESNALNRWSVCIQVNSGASWEWNILRLLTRMQCLVGLNRTLVSSLPGCSSLSRWEQILYTQVWMCFRRWSWSSSTWPLVFTEFDCSGKATVLRTDPNGGRTPNMPCAFGCRIFFELWDANWVNAAEMRCVLAIWTNEHQHKINTGYDGKCSVQIAPTVCAMCLGDFCYFWFV